MATSNPTDYRALFLRAEEEKRQGEDGRQWEAAWLTGSALVQEYQVITQEGLEYSYLTNGLALVLLQVPYDEPGIWYYHLCEPNMDVDQEDNFDFLSSR